jgi:hypothetical protein
MYTYVYGEQNPLHRDHDYIQLYLHTLLTYVDQNHNLKSLHQPKLMLP